jgi:hypothetical protein
MSHDREIIDYLKKLGFPILYIIKDHTDEICKEAIQQKFYGSHQIKYIKIGDDVDDSVLKTKNVIDLSSQKLERLDKKNVSWGNNEYQEYVQQNTIESQNTLFSKLKYVAPNNNEVDGLKSEINDLKTQISILNDKFDKLMGKFT